MTTLLIALASASPAHASQTLFYTGDPNTLEATGDYDNPLGGPLSLSQVFEPFTVTGSSGWDVNSVYFNELDLASDLITSAGWSISSGMAPGDPGVMIASGTGTVSGSLGSDDVFTISGLNVVLRPGTYWLNITPNSESGRLFANATSGANSQNVDLQGAALWYEPGIQYYSATDLDFSAGATGEVIPEPSTLWMLLPMCVASAAGFARKRQYARCRAD